MSFVIELLCDSDESPFDWQWSGDGARPFEPDYRACAIGRSLGFLCHIAVAS
jgi:hypothetical protein